MDPRRALDINEGRSPVRHWAVLLATSGHFRDRHWAVSHGRRHLTCWMDSGGLCGTVSETLPKTEDLLGTRRVIQDHENSPVALGFTGEITEKGYNAARRSSTFEPTGGLRAVRKSGLWGVATALAAATIAARAGGLVGLAGPELAG